MMTEFCEAKKRKIQSSDWKDQPPDTGISGDVEVSFTSPPGGGVSPSSGPGGASASAGTRFPAPTDKEEEECPDPKPTKRRVTMPLTEIIERNISPRKGAAYRKLLLFADRTRHSGRFSGSMF